MNPLEAVSAVTASAGAGNVAATAPCMQADQPATESFAELMARGIEQAEAKVDHANALVREFAIDGSVPLHEVTIALEEARIAVDLAMQVRTRVLEGYREIMNMQL
jgi:flagellar hook-basal body complex protein FliE